MKALAKLGWTRVTSWWRPTAASAPVPVAPPAPDVPRPIGTLPLAKPLPAGAQRLHTLRAQEAVPTRGDGRPDGWAYAQAMLQEIRKLKALDPNRRCVVVFDLDNTLFDTRARTQAVLAAFDPIRFGGLSLEQIGWNAAETCAGLGLSSTLAEAAQAHWAQAFWSGANFGHDQVMEVMAELVLEAHRAGAEIYYLSGRIDALRGASEGQLRAAGLPLASPNHLVLKASVEVRTSPFKAEWLLALEASGAFVGWFATDSDREVNEIRRHEAQAQGESDLPLLLVEHPLTRIEAPGSTTPVFGEVTARLRPQTPG